WREEALFWMGRHLTPLVEPAPAEVVGAYEGDATDYPAGGDPARGVRRRGRAVLQIIFLRLALPVGSTTAPWAPNVIPSAVTPTRRTTCRRRREGAAGSQRRRIGRAHQRRCWSVKRNG